jgi:hypothetical protein
MRRRTAVLALLGLILTLQLTTAHATPRDPAPAPLEAAIKLYVQGRGVLFRGECGVLAAGVVSGLCYEATSRVDGVAEVWLSVPNANSASLVLFEPSDTGWVVLTRPIAVTSSSAAIDVFADWSALSGSWFTGACIFGFPGIGSLSVQDDGSGSFYCGRFTAGQFQVTSFEHGIALLCVVGPNDDPSLCSPRALWALVLLDNGTGVISSVIIPGEDNVPIGRTP